MEQDTMLDCVDYMSDDNYEQRLQDAYDMMYPKEE